MTAGQARAALSGFLIVMVGVGVNALLLQARPPAASEAVIERALPRSGRDQARKVAELAQADRTGSIRGRDDLVGERALRIARFAPASAKLDALPEEQTDLVTETDATSVAAIQRELAARGYGPLVSDGIVNLPTRAAIMAYEHDQGLALTGQASEQILKRLLLGLSPGTDTAGKGLVRSVHAEKVTRSVQQWLSGLGYLRGRIDGRLGDDTIKAIRDFELDKGMVPRGRISAELIVRLNGAAAPAKAATR